MGSTFAAACALVLSIAPSAFAEPAPVLDEITALRRVCAVGPAVARARAERRKGQAAVVSAGVLPNPELFVEHRRTLSILGEQETTIGVSVPLGLGGRRFLLQDAAEARLRQGRANAQVALLEAAIAFREAFVTASLDQARLGVLSEQQRALDALTVVIQGLARGGESAGYALLRQQTQARLHRRLVQSMEARAAASRTMLEVWIGDEIALAPVKLEALAGGAHAQAVGARAPDSHPRVESLDAAAQASGIEAQAARRRWVPEVTVSAGYRSVAGFGTVTGHGLAVGLTVPLTLFDHGQGEAARADADRASASAAADGSRWENAALSKAALQKLAMLEASTAGLLHAVVDASSLQAKAITLYAAGEASITELLDVFRATEEARLARIDLAEEIARARLNRMRAVGTLFDPTLDRACGRASEGGR